MASGIVSALVIWGLLLIVVLCGARAVWTDMRAHRWIWAALGALATATGFGALLLVVTHASMTAPLGL